MDISKKMSLLLKNYAKNNLLPEKIKIKFTADGMNLSKTGRKLLVASFSFIEPQIKENSDNSLPAHFIIGNLDL